MTQFVFMPLSGAWKVTYGTNFYGQNMNISIHEIKSEKNGVVTTGLIPEAAALGMIDEYIETTVMNLDKMAKDNELNMYPIADRMPLVNANTALCRLTGFTILGATEVIIDQDAFTIAVAVPALTPVVAMKPIYTTTNDAVGAVGVTTIVSGVTEIDFTAPKVLVITSDDRSEHKDYTITVTVAA